MREKREEEGQRAIEKRRLSLLIRSPWPHGRLIGQRRFFNCLRFLLSFVLDRSWLVPEMLLMMTHVDDFVVVLPLVDPSLLIAPLWACRRRRRRCRHFVLLVPVDLASWISHVVLLWSFYGSHPLCLPSTGVGSFGKSLIGWYHCRTPQPYDAEHSVVVV